MELLQGTSLRAYIGRGVPLPVAWAAALAAQIATVLSYAHAVPVVHRDLKPENVLVNEEGAVKVLDFGIAAILGTGTTKITATGYPVGTSRYMSPEQIRGAQITPQSDLYALGCVLYELLCGRSVFDGRNDYLLWRQHTSDAPRPPRSLRPGLPAGLERLVLDLLEKTPERRPADARSVYKRLAPFLPPSGSLAPAVDGRLVMLPDPTRPYRRPNAPRPLPGMDQEEEVPLPTPPAEATDAAPLTSLRDAIRSAIDQSVVLLREERFSQAAEVLQEAIVPASDALGAESPHVLKLRARRAAILVRGGAARRALPEFDALAAAYARSGGRDGSEALKCRRQAAHCRAELGRTSEALKQFRDVLDLVIAQDGITSTAALELRRSIGVLLLAEDDEEAAVILGPLHEDLCHLLGPDHEETREVADLLTRLRLSDRQRPGA
jgi:tetratricopeptide (TPR) repeat protein